jgi:hypothetical protein
MAASGPFVMQPEWFVALFVLWWLFLTGLLAYLGGWTKLAGRFRADGPGVPVDGERFRFASGSLGRRAFPVSYGNCLRRVCGCRSACRFAFSARRSTFRGPTLSRSPGDGFCSLTLWSLRFGTRGFVSHCVVRPGERPKRRLWLLGEGLARIVVGKVSLAFSELELKRIKGVLGPVCERRSPAHMDHLHVLQMPDDWGSANQTTSGRDVFVESGCQRILYTAVAFSIT